LKISKTNSKIIIITKNNNNEYNFHSSEVDIRDSLTMMLYYFSSQLVLSSNLPFYLPKDDLLVLVTAFISFLSEFKTHEKPITRKMCQFFKSVLFTSNGEAIDDKRKILQLYLKIKLIKLLCSYISDNEETKQIFIENFGVVKMYEEIFIYMKSLIQNLTSQGIIYKGIEITNQNCLRDIYITCKEFQNSQELKYCIILFKYIRLLEIKYKILTIQQYFKHIREVLTDKTKENNNMYSYLGLIFYDFFSEIIPKVEIRHLTENGSQHTTSITFFVKSPVTYLLSKHARQNFLSNVDRSSGNKKVTALLENSYYFLYQMFYYYEYTVKNKSVLGQILQRTKFEYCEIVNYIIIVIHQILLLNYYIRKSPPAVNSKDSEFSDSEKFSINSGNFILSIIQIVYLTLMLNIWFIYYLPLRYQKLMMNEYMDKLLSNSSKFSLKFGNDFLKENKKTFATLNQNVRSMKKLKIIVFDILIYNRMINVLLSNLILLSLYLSTSNSIFLIVPVVFIADLFDLLTNIVFAIRLKWKQLTLVILFNYLLVYFFSWVEFLYFYKLYTTEVFVDSNGTTLNENLCSNAFECWINSINYGVRAGGGIGDALPKASFYQSSETFAKLFIFNISFHIIIVLILGNIFLGVIVDTFAELRDEKQKFEKDSKDVCFICQLTRKASAAKMIDFDEHVKKDHCVWTYLDFIVYLLLNKPNSFNQYELDAYKKLKERNLMWIPDNS
jgi:hypothetical protein